MANQRKESAEETVQKIRELQQTIFLPSEPVNRIIDNVLPKDYTIDDETRAACVYTLSIFNVCLGTAAFDEMEKRNQDELQTSHLKAALKQMRFKLPKIKADVDEHKKELEKEEEIFEQSNSETESDLDSSDDNESVDSRDSVDHEISSENDSEDVEEPPEKKFKTND